MSKKRKKHNKFIQWLKKRKKKTDWNLVINVIQTAVVIYDVLFK